MLKAPVIDRFTLSRGPTFSAVHPVQLFYTFSPCPVVLYIFFTLSSCFLFFFTLSSFLYFFSPCPVVLNSVDRNCNFTKSKFQMYQTKNIIVYQHFSNQKSGCIDQENFQQKIPTYMKEKKFLSQAIASFRPLLKNINCSSVSG